jgi:hypothetical protein
MIAEIGASLAALKEAFSLVKVIQDAKSDAEIQQATFDLRDRLSTLQMQNINLEELINYYREKIVNLEKEKADRDSFNAQSKRYSPHKMASGAFVYVSKLPAEENIPEHYLCTNCYQNSVISVLQPSTEKHSMGGYFVHSCLRCKSDYKMGEVPPMVYQQVPSLRGR